ncbi:serine/threonine-protein kinase [Streptomyces rhizosphaerihabitans]|uniref:serine/threonine-protein kinase n=1 Tax=Streptomyces rhizosphaerihabitans TaxID=1266770 RepID=UPI0021BF085C|nr:serine/threonine protein kinase [Streptomyces rhizosphaerihabitans]
MGRVWRAADEMLDRQVAVKEMRIDGLDPEDTRTRRERTLREARATARIDHPGVVRIYDVVDAGERLWIVMELVAGRSLERIVVEDGPLDTREAARVGFELVRALRQVHAQGVLHRDIKPGNVLVERAGRHRVVLTDFGIAALQDAEALTMVGMLVGSPDYMAPERISGRPQGPPSDVWSLGATLCAALGGRSPFSRSTTLATLHAVLYEEPELPSGAGELQEILAALLEKDPTVRPGLEELEAGLEELVRPPRTGTRTRSPAGPPTGEPEYDVASPFEYGTAREPAPGNRPAHQPLPESDHLSARTLDANRDSQPEPAPEPTSEPAPEPASEPAPDPAPEPDPTPGRERNPTPGRERTGPTEGHDLAESATRALLDVQFVRAARQPPVDLPEATPPPGGHRTDTSDPREPGPTRITEPEPVLAAEPEPETEPVLEAEAEPGPVLAAEPEAEAEPGNEPEYHSVHDAVPIRPTPTLKSPPGFRKDPQARSPEPSAVSGPEAVTGGPDAQATANASTEVPSEPRAEPSSPTPSEPRAEPGTGAPSQLPTAPVPVVPPLGELPDPAVSSGSAEGRSQSRGRRRTGFAAAGVVAAGAVAWAVVAMTGGPPGGSTGAATGSSTSTASTTGGPSSRAPTVEGTSRPPGLPPGAHREAGGYAWVTPKGWRRDLQTGSEVHYTSPDGAQELAAKSSLAKGHLMDTWTTSERNARQGQDYRKIRLEETTFRGRTAVVWEYTFTLKGVSWHARLLGFDADGKSYQINTWYHQDIEDQALTVYNQVKNSFTVL